jgi:DNA-binding MarR family transcriptional regulator
MSSTPTFSPQVIGQTEKTLNAILGRLLTGTGVTEPQWVTLTVTVASDGAVDRDQLVTQLTGLLRVSAAEAQGRLAELADAQLLVVPVDAGSPVKVTDAGRELYARIRAAVTEATQRLWGDLPAEDLAVTGRVLSTILTRASAELAAA